MDNTFLIESKMPIDNFELKKTGNVLQIFVLCVTKVYYSITTITITKIRLLYTVTNTIYI